MSDKFGYSLVTSDINAVNGSVSVWDGCTGVNLMVLNGNKLANNSMTVVRDTVVGCVDGKSLLEVWKMNNDGKKKVIPLPSPGRAIEYSSKFNILACFLGNEVFMWQPDTGKLLAILRHIHCSSGTKIIFTNSSRVVTVDDSGLVALWTIDMVEESDCVWKCRPFGVTEVHTCIIERLEALIVASSSGKVIVLSLLNGSPLSEMLDIMADVHCILCNYNTVFFGCNKGTLAKLCLDNMTMIKTLVKDSSEVDYEITQLAFTPNMLSIIVVINRRTAFLIDLITNNVQTKRQFTFGSPLNCLRVIQKSGDMFFSNSTNSKILIKRLEFSLDNSTGDGDIEVVLGERELSAEEVISKLDTFSHDRYYQLKQRNCSDHKVEFLTNVFSVLN